MARHRAGEDDLEEVELFLTEQAGLGHLRARRRADLITLESGPPHDAAPHARLRRVAVHLWRLELPMHTGRWEVTPFRDHLTTLLALLVRDFGWCVAPIDEPPR